MVSPTSPAVRVAIADRTHHFAPLLWPWEPQPSSHIVVSLRPTRLPRESSVGHTPRQIDRISGLATERTEEDGDAKRREATGCSEGTLLPAPLPGQRRFSWRGLICRRGKSSGHRGNADPYRGARSVLPEATPLTSSGAATAPEHIPTRPWEHHFRSSLASASRCSSAATGMAVAGS